MAEQFAEKLAIRISVSLERYLQRSKSDTPLGADIGIRAADFEGGSRTQVRSALSASGLSV